MGGDDRRREKESALFKNGRVTSSPRFQLGDRVLVEPSKTAGIIVGVRYGEIAYDVLCGGEYFRNISPDLKKLAST